MKKIFVDVYLAYNFGDDLFVDILAKKFPNTEFTLNYVGNNYDKFIKKYSNLSRRKYSFLDKVNQKLRIKDTLYNYDKLAEEYDALIFIGGSIFREESYYKSLLNDRTKLVQAFKNRNKKVFILGANFGPIKTQKFVEEYREFFKLCDDICFRDKYSYNIFKELNQVRYNPDIVFQLDVSKKVAIKKDLVGFSIIEPNHKDGLSIYREEYIESNIKCIKLLVDKGNKCCLMSFCKKEGDLSIANEIFNRLEQDVKEKVFIFDYCGDIEKTIQLISTFKLFIAARFHANIIGLLLNVPILPIIYSDKTSNMLNDLGFEGEVIYLKDINRITNERIIFNNNLSYCLEYEKVNSINQFKNLNKFIKEY